MRDWAFSGRVKIDRTNEHIRHLEAEITAFRERRPYPCIRQPNPDDEYGRYGTVFDIQVREEIPAIWGAIAADAIHNLSVALDYLWQRAVWGSKVAKGYQFPVYPSPESAKARFKREPSPRMKRVVDVLFQADAFDVGNPFWTIKNFDNADKHDTMVLVAHFLTGFQVDSSSDFQLPPDWRLISSRAYVIEQGAILYSVGHIPPEVDMKPELTFDITFGESEVLKGEAVLPTLQHFSTAVESLAAALAEKGLLA